MKYIKILFLTVLFSSLALVSCDRGFEDLNKNPNEATSIPAGLMIADPVRVAANSMYSTFWGGDMGACWSQQWAKVQYNDEARYIPRESVLEGTVWKNMYEDVCSDARTMRTLAETEGNNNLQAIAMTIEAFGFLTITDAFGDVPFSEALDPSNFQPKYDAQQDVYAGCLAMLDNAIAKFGSGDVPSSSDIVFEGSVSQWKKFASSLKFRALMRISAKQDVSGALQDLVDAGNMMSSTGDNASVNYLGADPNANPIFETVVHGTRGEWKINSVMVDMLNSFSDPRLAIYAQENGDGELRGKPSGYTNVPNDDYNYDNVSPIGEFFLDPQFPGYFMTYAELMFLRAEAAQKGYTNEDAQGSYEAGIKAAFADCGASGAASYLSNAGVAFNTNDALQQIAEQKWISLFGQGFEAWTEYRRTGFPVLSPANEGELNQIPSRYTYPAIEQSVNSAAYSGAVSAQGPNKLETPIWWMN